MTQLKNPLAYTGTISARAGGHLGDAAFNPAQFTDDGAGTISLKAGTGEVLALEGNDNVVVPPTAGLIHVNGDNVNVISSGAGSTVTMALKSAISTTSYATGAAAANMTLSGSTIAMGGTGPNVGLTVTPEGTGGFTLTTGDLIASAGNIAVGAAGKTLEIKEGVGTGYMGEVQLNGGTGVGAVTIAGVDVGTSRVFHSRRVSAGAVGTISYAITPNTVTFTSSSGTDNSTIEYLVMRGI